MFPSKEAKDSGVQFSCITHALKDNENHHIVGWEPLLDHPKHVHHMDIFVCNSRLLENLEYPFEEDKGKCGTIPFSNFNGFGAVYDKGAIDGYLVSPKLRYTIRFRKHTQLHLCIANTLFVSPRTACG